MIENRFLLDTNAIIYLTTSGNPISPELETELNEADLFISFVTEIELFAKPEMSKNEEENLRTFLSERLSIIDISNDLKKEIISFRRSTKCKLPDCIIAATAITMDAILLTTDKQLLKLDWTGLKTQNIL